MRTLATYLLCLFMQVNAHAHDVLTTHKCICVTRDSVSQKADTTQKFYFELQAALLQESFPSPMGFSSSDGYQFYSGKLRPGISIGTSIYKNFFKTPCRLIHGLVIQVQDELHELNSPTSSIDAKLWKFYLAYTSQLKFQLSKKHLLGPIIDIRFLVHHQSEGTNSASHLAKMGIYSKNGSLLQYKRITPYLGIQYGFIMKDNLQLLFKYTLGLTHSRIDPVRGDINAGNLAFGLAYRM